MKHKKKPFTSIEWIFRMKFWYDVNEVDDKGNNVKYVNDLFIIMLNVGK